MIVAIGKYWEKFVVPLQNCSSKPYLIAEAAEAEEASATKQTGWRACRQAPMSNGRNSDPSKRRLTPGSIPSLPSPSSDSIFPVLTRGDSSIGLVAASYTGVRAYDLQIEFENNGHFRSSRKNNKHIKSIVILFPGSSIPLIVQSYFIKIKT